MRFNYDFSSSGRERTLLLLHGFISDMDSMAQIARTASPHFNILRVDLPGFGGTRSTDIDYTIETIADGLQSLLKELGLKKVDILGYSMGGRVALSFAINYPEAVERLIIESASPGIASLEDRQARLLIDRKRADDITANYTVFIDAWETMALFDSQKHLMSEERSSQRRNRLAQVPKEVADSLLKYGTGVQPSYWQRLKHITIPVLLVVGEQDTKFKSINSKMAEMLPDAQLVVIEGAGHNVHMESPKKFGTMMIDFLLGG
ncbi:2-succinyl-6-hydroxy-2,4-cyclohexadiene-1-carboxylate synthase [Salinicoccus sesuvii]|uniref:Putative 2-succinyl-6-hydroxy-2,4-cyclohexadiene-1-carboxylate synthase n=1 Tax=Salinicoccus sesuvii TaxID=868281 RepID=A0ABV7N4G0_9STAP